MGEASHSFQVGICGATGVVGRELIRILEERKFPVGKLRLFASARSVGKSIQFRGEPLQIELLSESSFPGIEIVFFAAGGDISRVFAPQAAQVGCMVIDKSSAFRTDPEVPLVVPEINPQDLADIKKKGIVSSPNCSTIQMVMALWPIEQVVGIRRVVVSTYQSVSGAGQRGVDELCQQVKDRSEGKNVICRYFKKPIAYNCLPHIDSFQPNGYTKEEQKMLDETRRIFHRPDLKVTATTVRVPVVRGHSEAINVECKRPLSAEEARSLLSKMPGVLVVDDPQQALYPTALDSAERDEVMVGRIREDPSVENGLDLWVVSDNVRKGAALNAVQIAEALANKFF
jgi:aspartate-semialdehyde dehydrogenase